MWSFVVCIAAFLGLQADPPMVGRSDGGSVVAPPTTGEPAPGALIVFSGRIDETAPVMTIDDEDATPRQLRSAIHPLPQLDGQHQLDLRSYFFDGSLALYEGDSQLIRFQQRGGLRHHARITHEFDKTRSYSVRACAPLEGRGEYRLEITAGTQKKLSRDELRKLVIADLDRELQAREARWGAHDKRVADTLFELGDELKGAGELERCESTYRRCIAIREKSEGEDHLTVAMAASELGRLLHLQGRLQEALEAQRRTLTIAELRLGLEHSSVAGVLKNLAAVHRSLGEYEQARTHLQRAVTIWKAQENTAQLAFGLAGLAAIHKDLGEYQEALPLYQEVLVIHRNSRGPQHRYVASALNNLGLLYKAQRKYEEALPFFRQAVQVWESSVGKKHRYVAYGLNNWASVLSALDRKDEAQPLYERALQIREEIFGLDHPEVAFILNNLAQRNVDRSQFELAQQRFQRALRIYESSHGELHPYVATVSSNLGRLYRMRGDYSSALEANQRALEIRLREFGPEHPDSIMALHTIATCKWNLGQQAEALQSSQEVVSFAQKQLLGQLIQASESDAMLSAEAHKRFLELLVSLSHTTEDSEQAYRGVLYWKGLVSRVFGQSKKRLFAQLDDGQQQLLSRLRQTQRRLSTLLATARKDQQRQEELRSLRTTRERLEAELHRLGSEQLNLRPLTPEELATALPEGAIWIDFLEHREYLPARGTGDDRQLGHWLDPRMSAWIIDTAGKLTHVSLGESELLRQATRSYLRRTVGQGTHVDRGLTLDDDPEPTTETHDSALYDLLWAPLAPHVKGARVIFVSADSYLGTLPFEIIQNDQGRFLIEQFAFRYVQDSAALIEASKPIPEQPTLLAIGAVDYQQRGALVPADESAGTTSDDTAPDDTASDDTAPADPAQADAIATGKLRGDFQHSWGALPNTAIEVEGITTLHAAAFPHSQSQTLEASEATEERLKDTLPHYHMLHLATHGYFEPSKLPSLRDSARASEIDDDSAAEERLVTGYLPGLLSGLVCSGANGDRDPSRDNGLLTAEEVSWLDLRSCHLVVLSACQTALGTARSGQGMMSLRRSFHQAGARTVVSSLWKVRDDATRELMLDFYRGLWSEDGDASSALRMAQLRMLEKNRTELGNPDAASWGAFVLSGVP